MLYYLHLEGNELLIIICQARRRSMLDNNQLEAVNFYKGPCITLAGPGSGKTTVLVNRIKTLIEVHNVAPESILVITFTKDAALEMKSRFVNTCNNSKAGLVNFGTFHSVFYRILQQETHLDSNSILQGKSLISFIKEVIRSQNIEFDEQLIEGLYKEFSYLNNTLVPIEEYESSGFDNLVFREIYKSYKSMKAEFNKIDFDDMLYQTFNLFRDNPFILRKWQKRFEFFLIDEMQDMNDIQFEIIKMLAKSGNIFAVGDDDQSIYGFRGANPEIMKRFTIVYPECTKIILNKNYRSKKAIVDASACLIKCNEMRFEKNLIANSIINGNISVIGFRDGILEAEWISREIQSILKRNNNSSIGVLFRNKNQSKNMVNALSNKGIPFFIKDRVSNIYSHFIFKDIISFINISLGNGERSDFLRIYNKPNRYINRMAINKEGITFGDILDFYKDKPYMQVRVREMKKDIERIKTLRPCSAILYIRKKIGYDNYIEETSNSKKQYDDYMKVLDSILNLCKEFNNIKSFLEECNERIKYQNDVEDESKSRVFLYTFHASKGLEFDYVFILDVNEGITPSKKAENQKDLEEERRMFYVALTRAKENITICHIQNRNNERLFPSRFIEEMGK